MRGKDWRDAMRIAADYTAHTIEVTLQNPKKPWYGVDFEATLPELTPVQGNYYRWSDFRAWTDQILKDHPEVQ